MAVQDTPTDKRKFSIEEDNAKGKEVATRSSSPEDSSSETPRMAESADNPFLFVEILHSIWPAKADPYTSSNNFVNSSRVNGDENKTKFRGERNESVANGNGNEIDADARSQNVWIVAIVAVAFVAYKALSR